jgi:hypothetical protein
VKLQRAPASIFRLCATTSGAGFYQILSVGVLGIASTSPEPGLLSSLGVGFVATDAGLAWLTVGLLALGIGAVAWSTRQHRHLGPLGLMLLGSGILLVARLDQPSPMRVLIVGAVLAVVASLWNFWLERRKPSCCIEANEPTH